MPQTIFAADINSFCRKFLVERPGATDPTPGEVAELNETLFENLLLFDKLSLKIEGESIPIALLINLLTQKGFEALIEQGALEFVLWTEGVVFLVKNIQGLDGLASMSYSSPPHIDPEKSIETGLAWMRNAPVGRKRRHLVRRILPHFRVTEKNIAANGLGLVKTALKTGGLEPYGIPKIVGAADNLDQLQKHVIAKCAEDLIEYEFLLKNNMTSFSSYRYFSPFWDTAQRFQIMNKTLEGFTSISVIEGLPNLRELCRELDDPWRRLPTVRATKNARLFRSWLETTAGKSPDGDMVKAYLDSISESRGTFDAPSRKFLKTVAVAAVGVGASAVATGYAGAAIGAAGGVATALAVEKAAEFMAGTVTGVLDGFVLDRVAKGWSPRMFFDDISKMRLPRS